MGQLKDGIIALNNVRNSFDPKIGELEKQGLEFTDRVHSQAKMIDEGVNTLIMYLMEKLKKAGKTFETDGDRPLKSELDQNVASFGKGIVQAKTDVKRTISTLSSRQKLAVSELMKSVIEANGTLAKLKTTAEKKKSKWFKRAEYKTKIAKYLEALATIEEALKLQAQSLTKLSTIKVDSEWVDKFFPFHQDMTLKQVRALATQGLKINLQHFKEREGQVQEETKKFRNQYKSIEGQFAIMKKWIAEADVMEQVAEEK